LPQAVPQGCYISWIDPRDGDWPDRDSVFGDADANRHNIPAIYREWA
jgi:hypothetical protein